MTHLLSNYGLTSWHYRGLSYIVYPVKSITIPTTGRWPVLCMNGSTCSNKVIGGRWQSLHVHPNRPLTLPSHQGKRKTTTGGGGLANSPL